MRPGGGVQAESLPPQQHYHQAAVAGWKSPVPYLFGGLAAMLGLIAFALLILACSYWKLSGYVDSTAAGDSDGAGDEKPKQAESVFLKRVLVIMPGDEKPTQIATPATTRASSAGEEAGGKRKEEKEGLGAGGGDGVEEEKS